MAHPGPGPGVRAPGSVAIALARPARAGARPPRPAGGHFMGCSCGQEHARHSRFDMPGWLCRRVVLWMGSPGRHQSWLVASGCGCQGSQRQEGSKARPQEDRLEPMDGPPRASRSLGRPGRDAVHPVSSGVGLWNTWPLQGPVEAGIPTDRGVWQIPQKQQQKSGAIHRDAPGSAGQGAEGHVGQASLAIGGPTCPPLSLCRLNSQVRAFGSLSWTLI